MNCRESRQAVTAGLPADRAKADRHREHCSECRSFAVRLEQCETVLARPAADREDAVPRPGFSARVVSALPEQSSPLVWASVRLLPMTAALALTLLAWCLFETPAPSALWGAVDGSDALAWVSSE